jgi:hypothetical protein
MHCVPSCPNGASTVLIRASLPYPTLHAYVVPTPLPLDMEERRRVDMVRLPRHGQGTAALRLALIICANLLTFISDNLMRVRWQGGAAV